MTSLGPDRQAAFSDPGIPAIDAYIERYRTLTPWDGIPDLHVCLAYDFFAEEAVHERA